MRKHIPLLMVLAALLPACESTSFDAPPQPESWVYAEEVGHVESSVLSQWWLGFNDTALNELIGVALANSPDIRQAQAKVLEARGNRRSSRGVAR